MGERRGDLEAWLAPFLEALGHAARRRVCPAYVAGLIEVGERKSMQPMALRDGTLGCDQLHHFIAAGTWDAAPLEAELVRQAERLLGGADAVLIVDGTALPKKGSHSVGVAPHYAAGPANGTSLTFLRSRRRPCWRTRRGAPSVGAAGATAGSVPGSPLSGCVSPTASRKGSLLWARSICPARRCG